MVKSSKNLLIVSIVFIIIFVIFFLVALFAPLSYDGNSISPPDAMHYISKGILYLIALSYLILSLICLLYYVNRKIFIIEGKIEYVNFVGIRKTFDPSNCEIKVHRARFDLLFKQKKVCSISFFNDGEIFEFIQEAEKRGATIK